MTVLWGALCRTIVEIGGCCLLWFAGLLWIATPPAGDARAARTDAIVVLTGGSLRLQSGIDLLREGKGGKLFVSGVNHRSISMSCCAFPAVPRTKLPIGCRAASCSATQPTIPSAMRRRPRAGCAAKVSAACAS